MISLDMGNIVILSPHLDDAIISCFSQIQTNNVTIINIFAGTPDKSTRTIWDLVCGQLNSSKMMEHRKSENNQLMKSLGITSIDLDYLDHQYRSNNINYDHIMNNILKLSPSDSTFLVPLAVGSIFRHLDHVVTRNLGLALLERRNEVIFYADQPYMRVGQTNKKYLKKLTKRIESDLRLRGTIIPVRLNRNQQKLKLISMKAYRSQYNMLNLISLGALSRKNNLKPEILFKPNI